MKLIYTIKTSNKHFYFHYVSKRISDNVNNINLTTTESMFLLKLCEEHIQGIPATSRKKIETYIWGDVDVDRKTNLNQLVCTLRKKLGNLTSDSVVITQPKKGYSLDDCIVVKQHDPSAENEEKIEEALITSQSFLNKANSFLSVFFQNI